MAYKDFRNLTDEEKQELEERGEEEVNTITKCVRCGYLAYEGGSIQELHYC